MSLSVAELKALRAVRDGHVVRVYRAKHNILRGPTGVSSKLLWRLDTMRLIADGKESSGALERTCRQILTKAGKAALTPTTEGDDNG